VKLNTDAGFCQMSGKASTGVVVCDDTGKVLLTAWKVIRHCASAEEVQAEAYLQGIRLTAEWFGKPTYVELGCLNLIRAVHEENEDRSSWAGVIAEIKRTGNLLPGCYFSHIHRDASMVAHMLAQHSLRSQECVVMRHNMPDFVCSQVEVEAVRVTMSPETCNSCLID
jgi:hypothetical protein